MSVSSLEDMQTDQPHFLWPARHFFSPVKKHKVQVVAQMAVLNNSMSSWFMLPFYDFMVAHSSKSHCSIIKLSHCSYNFIFSFSLICQNVSHLLFGLHLTLPFQCQRLYKDQMKPERIQHQKMFMVFQRTAHLFFS